MERKEFFEAVRKEMEAITGEHCIINDIVKNNGVKLHGLVIRNKDSNIAPTIYLDEYYSEYMEFGMEDVIEKIQLIWKRGHINHKFDFDSMLDFNEARTHIFPKVINADMNLEQMADIPHKRFLDLCIVYYIRICGFDGNASSLISKNLQKMWNLSDNELDEIAFNNMKNSSQIVSLSNVLEKMTGHKGIDTPGMYVASNNDNYFGASVFIDKELLAKFAKENNRRNLVIIPSSVHETLLLTDDNCDEDVLLDMIRTVNRSHLLPTEVLSDRFYRFDAELMKYEMVG